MPHFFSLPSQIRRYLLRRVCSILARGHAVVLKTSHDRNLVHVCIPRVFLLRHFRWRVQHCALVAGALRRLAWQAQRALHLREWRALVADGALCGRRRAS